MNRVSSFAFRVGVAAIFLSFGISRMKAQEPASPPPKQEAAKQEPSKQEPAKKETVDEPEEERNPFAPEPAPTLPPGMAGSDANDPRAKLTPGLYDAGDASMGIKHVMLFKKSDAFQLCATDLDDSKVQETFGKLRIGHHVKIPYPSQFDVAL